LNYKYKLTFFENLISLKYRCGLREGGGKVAPDDFWDFFVEVGGESKAHVLTKNPKIIRTTCHRPTAFLGIAMWL
jgi:hypothetical protein